VHDVNQVQHVCGRQNEELQQRRDREADLVSLPFSTEHSTTTFALFREGISSTAWILTSVITKRLPIVSPKPSPPRLQTEGKTPHTWSFVEFEAFPAMVWLAMSLMTRVQVGPNSAAIQKRSHRVDHVACCLRIIVPHMVVTKPK
jgi:hypothetical protein